MDKQTSNSRKILKGTIKRKFNKVSHIIDMHIEEHSKKTAIVREKIVKLAGRYAQNRIIGKTNSRWFGLLEK